MSLYRQDEFVVLIYGLVQVACGVLLGAMWLYASGHPLLLAGTIEPRVVRSMTTRILAGPAINLAGVATSFISVPVAVVLFLCVPLLSLSHRVVDAGLLQLEGVKSEKD